MSNCVFSDNNIDDAIIANWKGSNCKITNSLFTKTSFNSVKGISGVAIYNDNVNSLSITGSKFTNFKSTDNSIGVAIQNFSSSNILISKCEFKNTGKGTTIGNIEKKGCINVINTSFINDGTSIDNLEGSIFISKSTFKNSKARSITNYAIMKITDSTFRSSQSTSILNDGGTVKILRSNFKNNKNIRGAGVINNHGSMFINSSNFKNNKGKTAGAITNTGSMSISGSKFINNTAKRYGGAIQNGIHYNPGILKVTNTKFKNNVAGKTYKAIFNEKDDLFDKNKVTTIKVTITPKDGDKFKK